MNFKISNVSQPFHHLLSCFLFCKDDSEMLRLSKKLSNFSMMFYRETSQLQPPPPNEHMTFLVDKIDMP